MAKLVDALALGASAARHGGSSPLLRTIKFGESRIFCAQKTSELLHSCEESKRLSISATWRIRNLYRICKIRVFVMCDRVLYSYILIYNLDSGFRHRRTGKSGMTKPKFDISIYIIYYMPEKFRPSKIKYRRKYNVYRHTH